MSDVRLGVDLGTANTVAVLSSGGRDGRPLLFDGSPLLPSAVCLDAGGRLLVGRDAVHLAAAHPESYEPHPKRCVDDRRVLLGGTEVPVDRLLAAVLGRVAEEATRVAGKPVGEVVLTCPAAWGGERRGVLLAAAASVWPAVRLVAEPVAAAHKLVEVAGDRVPVGASALVYDFGAGTFDATVLRRTDNGFEVLATEGLPDSGGLDVDAAIVAHFGTVLADRDPAAWERLTTPESMTQRRGRRQFWDNVRAGKEMLSRSSSTMVHVPTLDADLPLGREKLDELSRPVLDRTIGACRAALTTAGVAVEDVAAVFLAGGSSRMPLVATTLHQSFGTRPVAVDQPELVVAEGSLLAEAPTAAEPPGTGVGFPGAAAEQQVTAGSKGGAGSGGPPTLSLPVGGAAGVPEQGVAGSWPPAPAPATPGRRSRSRPALLAGVAVAVVVTVVAGIVALAGDGGRDPADSEQARLAAGSSGSPTPSPTPSPSPTMSLAPGLDPCLIGTWQRVSSERTLTIDGRPVQFSGKVDVTEVYRADGTLRITFGKEPPGVAWVNGVKWAEYVEGSGTVSWRVTGDGHILFTNPKVKGTWRLTRNGKYNNGGKLSLSVKPVQYVCTEDSYVAVADFYSIQARRVVESP
nr:Hsp70 family protein [Micromonospora sp. DSM 115978]